LRKPLRRFTIIAAVVVTSAAVAVPFALSSGSDDNVSASAPVTASSTTVPPTTTTTTSQAPDTTTVTATTEEVPVPTATEVTPEPAQAPEVQPTTLDVTLTPGEASTMTMDIDVVGGVPQCKSPYEAVELLWETPQDFAGNEVTTHMGESETPTVYVDFAGAFNPIVAFIVDGTVIYDVVPTKYGTEIMGVMKLLVSNRTPKVVACTDADW
jgi:cytoskeletal protein RodZ